MLLIVFCFVISLQVRVVNGVPPTADYSFAKYNKVLFSFLFFYFSWVSFELLLLSSLPFCFFSSLFIIPLSFNAVSWYLEIHRRWVWESFNGSRKCLLHSFLSLVSVHLVDWFCSQLVAMDQGRDISVVWTLWKVWSPFHCHCWSLSLTTDCRGIEGSLLYW